MEKIIQDNIRRTYIYMGALTLFITVIGYLISHTFNLGITGTSIFLIISGIINFIAFFFSDKLIIKASHAKLLHRRQAPEYIDLVEKLSKENNLPMPKLYYLEDDAMNAFATGRDYNHSAVVVTTGLLEKLTPNEIRGVVGHELAHIKSYDMRVMATVTILVGLISILADIYWRSQLVGKASEKDNSGILSFIGLALAVVAPLSAMFIQLAISRKRELSADALSASMVKDPAYLSSALLKISRDRLPLPNVNPTTAHLFIANPIKNGDILERLFSTHPPIEERISILNKMKGGDEK